MAAPSNPPDPRSPPPDPLHHRHHRDPVEHMPDERDPGNSGEVQEERQPRDPGDAADGEDPEPEAVERGGQEPAAGAAGHPFPGRPEDVEPADRIADQPDQVEMHEIAGEIVVRQAEGAEQAAREAVRREVGPAERGADQLAPEIEGRRRDGAGDEHQAERGGV